MKPLTVILALSFAAALSPGSPGQTRSGAISGIICDSTQAVIPWASVLIRNQETETSQTLQAGPKGEFVASDLAPGKYTVEVSMSCFHTSSQPNILVSSGSNSLLRIRLGFCGVKHLTKETRNFSTRVEKQTKTELEKDLINIAERIPCSTQEGSASGHGSEAPNCAGMGAMQYYFGLVAKSKSEGSTRGGEGLMLVRAYYGASTEFNEGDKQWLVKLRLEFTIAPTNSCGEGVFLNRWILFDEEKNVLSVDDHPPCVCDSGS